jgi:hypothetical protein
MQEVEQGVDFDVGEFEYLFQLLKPPSFLSNDKKKFYGSRRDLRKKEHDVYSRTTSAELWFKDDVTK